jgi:hypothetical protein
MPGSLALFDVNTYTHYDLIVHTDMSMGAAHRDPNDPQIEEFQPSFELTL